MGANSEQAYPVLLAGGIGTRLWPVSRESYPKQLAQLTGNDSLVQSTVKRLIPYMNPERLRLICGQAHCDLIKRHLQEIGIDPQGKIIAEPCGRNTAPAILLAVLRVAAFDPDAVLCFFPADHVVRNVARFHDDLATAVSLAYQDHIVTFGILPQYPETGYGYIEGGAPVADGALLTKRFVEKPDRATAEEYVAAGNFFWNSGMFAFKASVIMEEFKRYQRPLFEQMQRLDQAGKAIALSDYQKLPSISFDYAIMEFTKKGVVLPSDFGWSDIGTWKSLYDFLPKDHQQNVIDGDVIARNTQESFIFGQQRLIAAYGLRNMVIVDTPDTVFISNLQDSRGVKSIVAELKDKGRVEYDRHRTVHRPWGHLTLLKQSTACRIERRVLYAAAECEWIGSSKGITHLIVEKGSAAVSYHEESLTFRQGDTTSLMHGADATICNQSHDDPLIVVCISIFYG